jgi:hypothetical protein
MNGLNLRTCAIIAFGSLLAACSHSTALLPPVPHAASSGHGRHVRDLPVIGHTTSRDSFNTIYIAAGMGAAPGVEQVVDLGSLHDGGGAPPPPPPCTDPTDQCPVAACDPSDPDCVVQVATLGGPAQPGDTCGIGSKPVGSPLKATGRAEPRNESLTSSSFPSTSRISWCLSATSTSRT